MVTGRFGPIPVWTPGRFVPIPFRSGRFDPNSWLGHFGPTLVSHFGLLCIKQFLIGFKSALASPIYFTVLVAFFFLAYPNFYAVLLDKRIIFKVIKRFLADPIYFKQV